MGAKKGRPPKDNPMKARLQIKVTQQEHDEIIQFKDENNLTLLQLLRIGIEAVKKK